MRFVREARLSLEARMEGPTVTVRDLLALTEGSLLMFDYPVERSIELLVNGCRKYTGQVVATGRKRACLIESIRRKPGQGKISEEAGGGAVVAASTP
jgi:flagellar motor switch protein FliM